MKRRKVGERRGGSVTQKRKERDEKQCTKSHPPQHNVSPGFLKSEKKMA